tara:strand:- start:39 stop:320 length:282 start_codon:yes stop_codon:yes gene_type:complete
LLVSNSSFLSFYQNGVDAPEDKIRVEYYLRKINQKNSILYKTNIQNWFNADPPQNLVDSMWRFPTWDEVNIYFSGNNGFIFQDSIYSPCCEGR